MLFSEVATGHSFPAASAAIFLCHCPLVETKKRVRWLPTALRQQIPGRRLIWKLEDFSWRMTTGLVEGTISQENPKKTWENRWNIDGFFCRSSQKKKTDPLRLMGFLWREQLYILNLDYWWVNNEYMMANDRIFCVYSEFILRLFWLNWILTGIFHGLWPPKYS